MKKLNSKKKVLKGMTLLEVIISIAIVAVMTMVLVATSSSINSYLRSANDVNDRVALQAPVAQAKDKVEAGTEYPDGIEIALGFKSGGKVEDLVVSGRYFAAFSPEEMADHDDEFGSGLNLKYVTDLQTTTAASDDEAEEEAEEEGSDE